MNQRIRIVPPINGISEDLGEADQPQGTTPKALNVRPLDPGSGRVQIAQRAGYTDLLASAMPGRVEAAATITYDDPKLIYQGPNASTIQQVWSAGLSGDQNIVAVHVDRYGNLYALSDAGSFIKYGPDGEEVGRQTYYATGIERPVRRIGTDYEGNVYVAVSSPAGEASTLIKFEALEDDQFDIAWRWSGLWGIRDFAVFAGQIAVARFYALSDVEETENVAVLSQLYASEPTVAYETALPRPVSCLAFAESGEVLFASAANPYRNQPEDVGESWQAINVQWSPHEIEDVSGLGASWRLHWWIDAETLQDYVTGDRVKTVKDRRWLHTELPVEQAEPWMVLPDPTYSYYAPTDNAADRAGYPGWHTGDTSKQTFMMPVYRARGAGLKPSLRFNGPDKLYGKQDKFGISGANVDDWDWFQNPLGRGKNSWKILNAVGSGLFFGQYYDNYGPKSSPNLAAPSDDGPDKDGVMDRNRQPIPGSDNMSFAMFMVIRVEPSENREVIWHHKAVSGFEIALLHNIDSADLTPSCDLEDTDGVGNTKFFLPSTPGKLTLFIGRGARVGTSSSTGYLWYTHKGSHAAHVIASADTATEQALTNAWGAAEAKQVGNDKGIAIVCISINKENNSGAPYNSCEFRVNGRVIDTFHIDEDLATGLRSELRRTESVFGMSTDRQWVTSFSNMYAWRGSLCEAITINGKTSDESLPNLDAVGYVSDSGNARDIDSTNARQWTDVSVEDYVADPIGYTDAASEIERMEGYLAYKWGCQDVLPTSATGAVTTGGGFQNVHPFARHNPPGGSGVQDVYPVGRAAAGGVIAGDTAAALQSEKEILGKVGSDGVVRWAIDGNGHGLGVVSGVDGYLCAVGRKEGESRVVAKKVRDLGNAVRVTGDNVWEYESDTQTDTQPVLGLAMDAQNNLYWPQYYKGDNTPDVVEIELTANLVGSPNDTLGIGEISSTTFGYVATSIAPPGSGAGFANFMIGADKFETANNCAAAVNANGAVSVAHAATVPNALFSASVYTNASGNPVIQLRRKVFNKRLFVNVLNTAQWSFSSYPETAVYTAASGSELIQLPFREWGLLAIGEEAETLYEYTPQNGKPVCIAVDPQYPLMLLNPDKQGTAENLYVGLDAPGEGQDTVVKYQQLKRTFRITDNPGPRRTTHVAVANGGLYTTTRDSAPYYAPGGAARFNRTSPFVKLWVYRQKLYGLDGLNYVVYDPKKELVEEWRAEGKGKIPKGAKLACVYGDRIVLARTDEDPHNLHMSARGDANDWDTAPDILTPLSAFSGNSTGNLHFRANDLVNCLIPARDDLLYIGGDRSFTRLTGDPGGQGQIDNISQLEGIAFGDAYAVGPSGEVYVKGINTGIWRIDPAGSVNLLTEGWIERRMQNLDLSIYDVRMAWSFRQKGLHVYVVPKVTGPRVIESFWWDAKAGGWWMDEWSDETVSPTCVTIWDGDEPGDRGVVIGCQDGMLRVEDEDAYNDGSKRIESEVVLGPLTPADAEQVLFTALEPVLVGKPGYGGVWLEVYTAPIPDFQGGENPVFRHYVGPGYQGDLVISALANQIWVRLTNGAIGEKWALQTLFARARVAGARRM